MWFNEWFGTWHGQWYGEVEGEPEQEPSIVCDFVVNFPDAQVEVFGYYDVEEAFIRRTVNESQSVVSLSEFTVTDSIVALTCPNNVQETTVKQAANNVAEVVSKPAPNRATTSTVRATANTVTVVKNDCG